MRLIGPRPFHPILLVQDGSDSGKPDVRGVTLVCPARRWKGGQPPTSKAYRIEGGGVKPRVPVEREKNILKDA